MQPIDPDLLEDARTGDRDAFAEIVRLHFRLAFVWALAIVQDSHEAEDVVQDAFVRCWQRLGQCRSAPAFAGWLRSIVRSVAYNRLERERIRETEPLDTVDVPGRRSPELDLERAALRDRLSAAMRGLTDVQREVLLLYDLEGYRHAEIADSLGISEAMSRRHLSNARQRMRRALGEPRMRSVRE